MRSGKGSYCCEELIVPNSAGWAGVPPQPELEPEPEPEPLPKERKLEPEPLPEEGAHRGSTE